MVEKTETVRLKRSDTVVLCPNGCGCRFVLDKYSDEFHCVNCKKDYRIIIKEIKRK